MSKETKFTKGEWFIAGRYVESETGKLIHQISGGYVAQTKTETANAHLIKTAPKLYAEIESEIEFLTKLMTDNFTVNCSQSFEIGERINSLDKALAEARGE